MEYPILFLAVVLENCLPAPTPPTWTILVFAYTKFDLNIYLTVLTGVFGATLGRAILSYYINWFSHIIFNKRQHKNLAYLGKKFGHTHLQNATFVFLYSLTPLSTSAVFIAAGMAKIQMRFVLIGFFFGRLVSYSALITSTKAFADGVNDLTNGILSWRSLISTLFAILVIFSFIFIDWMTLFEKKKLKLNFKVWKWNKE